jgi:hypothetical protein
MDVPTLCGIFELLFCRANTGSCSFAASGLVYSHNTSREALVIAATYLIMSHFLLKNAPRYVLMIHPERILALDAAGIQVECTGSGFCGVRSGFVGRTAWCLGPFGSRTFLLIILLLFHRGVIQDLCPVSGSSQSEGEGAR